MSEYKILQNYDRHTLEEMVNKYLSDGWVLAGGVSTDSVGMLYQAVLFNLKDKEQTEEEYKQEMSERNQQKLAIAKIDVENQSN